MLDNLTEIIRKNLGRPTEALSFELSVALARMFPDKYILETAEYEFDVEEFVERGHAKMRADLLAHLQVNAKWRGHERGALIAPRNAACDVLWRGHLLKIVKVEDDCETHRYVIATNAAIAKEFFVTVCRTCTRAEGDILVFASGQWVRDPVLTRSIAAATFDNLVLSQELRSALLQNFDEFYDAEESYRRMRLPWKRGVLLLGPPGNGKTHAIKAMANRLKKPCLIVRSFTPQRGTVHGCIQKVFRRAREAAPCMLVLEDLDSLVGDAHRSFFLNEMDGFAANNGILTVATTNHPKKLDPALLHRPSRFDRKITFPLPDPPERCEFLSRIVQANYNEFTLSSEELDLVVEKTGGFSFAYLKELNISAAMDWMRDSSRSFAEVMLQNVDALRAQMASEAKAKPQKPEEPEEDDD